jgi:DNA-directed RNA polymerase specialized sigma24 family protein
MDEKLVQYAYMVMNRRYPGLANRHREDLEQEGRIALWQAEQSYDSSKCLPFEKYALFLAVKAMARFCIKEAKYLGPLEYEYDVEYEEIIWKDEDIALAEVREAIDALDPKVKEAVYEIINGGYNAEEAAKKVGTRKQAVIDGIKKLKEECQNGY